MGESLSKISESDLEASLYIFLISGEKKSEARLDNLRALPGDTLEL